MPDTLTTRQLAALARRPEKWIENARRLGLLPSSPPKRQGAATEWPIDDALGVVLLAHLAEKTMDLEECRDHAAAILAELPDLIAGKVQGAWIVTGRAHGQMQHVRADSVHLLSKILADAHVQGWYDVTIFDVQAFARTTVERAMGLAEDRAAEPAAAAALALPGPATAAAPWQTTDGTDEMQVGPARVDASAHGLIVADGALVIACKGQAFYARLSARLWRDLATRAEAIADEIDGRPRASTVPSANLRDEEPAGHG